MCEGTFAGGHANHGPVRIPGATMAEIERHAIIATLDAMDGSTSRAAEMLDISIRTIQYRISEYGISASKLADSARSRRIRARAD